MILLQIPQSPSQQGWNHWLNPSRTTGLWLSNSMVNSSINMYKSHQMVCNQMVVIKQDLPSDPPPALDSVWNSGAAPESLSKLPKCCFGIRCHKHTNHEGNSHDRRSNACQHRNTPQLIMTIEADENTESSGWTCHWTSIDQSDELKDIKNYAITDWPKNPTLEAWTMFVTCTTSRL